MTIRDRTTEFALLAEQMARKESERKQLVEPRERGKTEFAMLSAQVGKGIKDTTEKLANLTKLAKDRGLFMDKTVEIQNLTFVIKQDIGHIKQQIGMLEDCLQAGAKNQQSKSHSHTVVKALNSKLKSTVNEFKEALEIRNENLKSLQETKKLFTGNSRRSVESSLLRGALYSPESQDGSSPSGDVVISMNSSALMQLEHVPNQIAVERLNAVETIEKTIEELGQIFQQMGQIVAEHEYLVQRIDHNVEETQIYTREAEKQLTKYLSKISGNTKLIIKVFVVLIFFIFIFVVFFA
jgi:syntaxin 5